MKNSFSAPLIRLYEGCFAHTEDIISMRLTDTEKLSEKYVLNLCDGSDLGYVTDVQFCTETGQITAFIVTLDTGLFSFGRCEKAVIPWDKIECIGEDAILVRLTPNELRHEEKSKKGKWCRR